MTAARLTDRIILLTRIVWILLVFLVLVGVLLVMRTSRPAPVEPSPGALQAAMLSLPAMGARADGQLVRRPLFWASRTPYTPPEEVPQEVVPVQRGSVLDTMKIVGVVDSSDNAVIIVQIGERRRRIQLNESVQGWELISISSDQATFRGRTGDGALEEQALPLERIAVSTEAADPSVRARFAPAGSESAREGVEGVEGVEEEAPADETSESAEQPPAPAESGDPVEAVE